MFMREELSHHSPHEGLSRRQLEVLQYMWDGLHSKMIGEKMGLTSKGVEYHRLKLLKKWECDNIIQVIRLALRRSILEI